MYCANCGKQNNDGAVFCHYCGRELKKAQPGSGGSIPTPSPANTSETDFGAQGSTPVGPSGYNGSSHGSRPSINGTYIPSEPPYRRRQKKSAGVPLPVIAGIIVAVLLVAGIPLYHSFSKSSNGSGSNTPANNNGSTPSAPTVPAALFSDEAIEESVASYFGVQSTGELDAGALSEVTEMLIADSEIRVNGKIYYPSTAVTDLDVSRVTDYLPALQKLLIYSVNSVSCENSDSSSISQFVVADTSVVDELRGIETWSNLTELTVNFTDLTSMEYIAECPSLTTVNVAGNRISDISNMRNNTSITKLDIYDNQIHDHTPLANVKTVNVWGEGVDIFDPYSYDFEKMPSTRCIKVNIPNLHMRPVHSKKDGESNLLIRHCPQNYYIVLDTYQGSVYTWYKVGNDAWIGSANNYTTEYFN